MFKRRKPREITHALREMIWPSMGWRRVINYFYHRLFRRSDSNYRITGGLATGVAVSFTPLLGLHFVQAILFAHIMRQSKIAAMVGTFWGNPWTLPPMFYLDYKVGAWLMNLFWAGGFVALPPSHTLSHLLTDPMRLFVPLLIGGIICAIIFWHISYLILYYPVRSMQHAYNVRRLNKMRLKEEKASS